MSTNRNRPSCMGCYRKHILVSVMANFTLPVNRIHRTGATIRSQVKRFQIDRFDHHQHPLFVGKMGA